MIRKISLLIIDLMGFSVSVFAFSGPSKLIPEPVEFSVSEGFYTLKPDGSDVKVFIGGALFASKVENLPDFAKDEAYELVVGKKGVKIYAMTPEGADR